MKGSELEMLVKKSPIKIEALAEKIQRSKVTIYRWFKMDEVESENVALIGKAIGVKISEITKDESLKMAEEILEISTVKEPVVRHEKLSDGKLIKSLKDRIADLELEIDILKIKYEKLLHEKFGLES